MHDGDCRDDEAAKRARNQARCLTEGKETIMTLFKHELHIKERQTMVDITPQIRRDIEESGIKDGIVAVSYTHLTLPTIA